VSTKILWPRKGEVEVSYCRIPLNTDAFNKETVEHVLFRCANHDDCRIQLMDVVDDYAFLLLLRTWFIVKSTY